MPTSALPASAPGPATLVTDSLEKPSLDDRHYRLIRLDNELEALLVHDPETDKASASLDVNVGNFSDEDGMPGMAHAVEHLLFMGTKKFPGENEYNSYLSANSGGSNAYTASTSTNYFFEVAAKPADDQAPTADNPSPLRGALDRFSRFFVEPLFLSSTLDRELKAVDSENKKNLQSDLWRLNQLEKSLSNPKHPFCHFSTGNLEVLKEIPEAEGINVRDKFMQFHEEHYSANRMKLVVLGREPLDLLQNWTEEFFSDIVNKRLPQNRWENEPPFRPEDLGMQCFAKPVLKSRELNLVFPFINEEFLYKSQPSRYISHLIGHEGPGSIMAYTKNRGWTDTLTAGAYPVCPGTPGFFELTIQLTEDGLKNYIEVVKVVFQYVALLRESPPQEWIFEEQREMADVDFRFKQKAPASRFTSHTSSTMQKPIPREWLLSGQSRLRTFDPAQIEEGLEKITPQNMRLGLVSQDFPGNWDSKEKWYGTEYRYEKIPSDVMAKFEAALHTPSGKRIPELHLPHKNSFLPSRLEVEKRDVLQPALGPRLLRNDNLGRTWYKKDDTFWVPRANVIVSLKNPRISASVENTVTARLFLDLVKDALEEYAYDAELAGLSYRIGDNSRGIVIDVSGYNDKLHDLLQQVATTMQNLEIKQERFEVIKERNSLAYSNWQFNSAYLQVGDYLNCLVSERDYLVEELADELPNITINDVRLFQKQVLSQMYLETYVHGNLEREDALKVNNVLESTFQPRSLPRSQLPISRSLILPPGSNYVYNKTLEDPENVNHCVETWLYVGDRRDRTLRAKLLLMEQIAHEPGFDQLRTKEQLGYIVFTGTRSSATRNGLRILVQSERTPDYVDSRIEAFLVHLDEVIDNMSEAEFEGHKRSLILKRLEKPRNLGQESNRHWSEIASEYYDFENAQHDVDHVKPLTKTEIKEFYQRYISPSSSQRARISVHLHARGAGVLDSKIVDLLVEAGYKEIPAEQRQSVDLLQKYLKDVLHVSDEEVASIAEKAKESGLKVAASANEDPADISAGSTAITTATEITDIHRFKASLSASPGAHPVKNMHEYEDIDSKL